MKIDKAWIKTFALMLFSVIMMGLGVSLLVLTQMGTDPCSAMNYGVSGTVGLSFGTYQLIFNLILLIFVLVFNWRMIGTGTIGNMVVVGYAADFFTWIRVEICHIPEHLPLYIRLIILIPSLMIFITAAACYMNSGHGMAPYDAIPFIVSHKLEQLTGRKNLFQPIRLSLDLLATVIGYFTGGEVGLMTVLMVILLAPVVDFAGKQFRKMGIGAEHKKENE